MIDFGSVKAALRKAIAPLSRRTLVAARADGVPVIVHDGRVRFGHGDKHYDLPEGNVVLLPLPNTTTEAIAAHLLDQLDVALHQPGLAWAELTLAEASDITATVRRELR